MKFGENDFDKDSDRRAWRAYAAAWLASRKDLHGQQVWNAPEEAAEIADAMLEQERRRR